MTNLPTTAVATESPLALLLDPARFEHLHRVAQMLASSALFPAHLKNGDKVQSTANAMLVLNMANRLHEDPLTVAQNIYFVGGKPGWNTTYMISKANMHGVFRGPIDWDVTGAGDDLSVTAFAILAGTDRRVQATCGMAMARKEGWVKNAKYQSMPEQMLRYRSAAFLIRLYCPEVMIGIPAAVEVEMSSMRDVTPSDAEEAQAAASEAPAAQPETPKRRAAARPAAPATNDKPTAPEAEIVEAEEPADTEEKPAPQEDPVEEDVEGAAATEEAPKADAATNPEAQQFDFREVYNNIMNDVLDGAPVSGVKGFWSDKGLDAMKTAVPGLYAKLEAEFAAAEG